MKNQMNVKMMAQREKELVSLAFSELARIPGLHILADNIKERLGVFSFYIEKIHYNLIARLLSDRFGVQVRGGCACAGTYGHYLLDVSYEKSKKITEKINTGDLSEKPGWVRISLHPTMLDAELLFIIDALKQIQVNHLEWEKDYTYDKYSNEFVNNIEPEGMTKAEDWFRI